MQIKSVSSIAHSKLAKLLIYGGPGSGKTPLCAGVADTLLCITEPGTLSIRKLQTHAVECYDVATLNEFFTWLRSDTKEKNIYRNICVDSVSEMCSLHIRNLEQKGSKGGSEAHGLKVYGDMAKAVLRELVFLYNNKQFNIFLTAKRGEVDFEGVTKFRPYFPGKQLSIEVPHLFDGVFHLDKVLGKWENLNGLPTLGSDSPGKYVPALLTAETNVFTARDRSGALSAVEYPDLNYVLYKTTN